MPEGFRTQNDHFVYVSLMSEVVGYLRVSTTEQAESGAGLAAQQAAIEAAAIARGWELVAIEVDDGASGKSLRKRPALERAIAAVEAAPDRILVVSKLDRLSRSLLDFANLMAQSKRQGWGLVALDLGVDTTTSSGRLVANVMASVADWEREVIGERTREGLAARRAEGVRLGRPPVLDESVVDRIVDMQDEGLSLNAIARRLNHEDVPTAHGGRQWWASSVRAVVRSQRAPEFIAMEDADV